MQEVKNTAIVALLISLFAIIVAWIMEYIFALQPCHLCLIQRNFHWLIVAISAFTLLLPTRCQKKIKALSFAIVLSSGLIMLLAGFHFGVENKIFTYESNCSFTMKQDMSLEEFEKKISQADLVPCNIPQGNILGMSVAETSFLYSIISFVIILLFFINKVPLTIIRTLNIIMMPFKRK